MPVTLRTILDEYFSVNLIEVYSISSCFFLSIFIGYLLVFISNPFFISLFFYIIIFHISYFAVHVQYIFFVIKRERNGNGTLYLHLFNIITNICRTRIALNPRYFTGASQVFSKPINSLHIHIFYYHISLHIRCKFRLPKMTLFRY